MSCKSDSGFVEPLPVGMCTGWRGGGVLLACRFSVVEVGQMSEWGWVVYDIRCFQWAVQVGSKW